MTKKSVLGNIYDREMSKAFTSAKKRLTDHTKYGKKAPVQDIVSIIYTYDPTGLGGVGTRLSPQQGSKALKPFNMRLRFCSSTQRLVFVTQRDYDKPVPTNWCGIADTILVLHPSESLQEACKYAWEAAKFGRMKWKNMGVKA